MAESAANGLTRAEAANPVKGGPGGECPWSISIDVKQVARKRALGIVIVGVVAAGLGSAGLIWRSRVASGRWNQALAEVRVLEIGLDAKVDERPALWGETTDEHAQPHYDRALSLVAGWDVDTVLAAVRAEDDEARNERTTLVAEGADALEALHRGAHAANATRTVDWSRGFELPMRKLIHARFLTQLSEMKATILLEDGRELDAVGVLLDALQFAGDLSQGPLMIEEMVGVALLSPDTLVEGVADGSLLFLSNDAEQRLVSGVSALDRRLGWQATSFEGELVLGARELESVLQDENGAWGESIVGLANGGFGLTQGWLYAAEYVNAMQGLCADFDRAFAAGPSALFDELEHFPNRACTPENPISATLLPTLVSAYRGRFYSLGRFRLLAQAISRADPPDDPWLAEYLRVEESEEGTRLWLDHEVFDGLEIRVAR